MDETGWTNVENGFNQTASKNYSKLQLINHWDAMKGEWQLFKNRRRGHTGLGWNEARKTIDATNEWMLAFR